MFGGYLSSFAAAQTPAGSTPTHWASTGANATPSKTPEPFSGGEPGSERPIFVVQRHDARRLHYDFRLEEDGALASWAVPKGVPLEPGARALAVHVEDHPLEYGTFEGEIPAGRVRRRLGRALGHRHVRARRAQAERPAHGRPARQAASEERWSLVPAHLDGKEQNWLLIKRSDGDGARTRPRSTARCSRPRPSSVPHGGDWRYEVKFDGYRALAYIRGGDCRLVSRNGNDLTRTFRGGGEGSRLGDEVAERRPRR